MLHRKTISLILLLLSSSLSYHLSAQDIERKDDISRNKDINERVELELDLVDDTESVPAENTTDKELKRKKSRKEIKELSAEWSDEFIDTSSVKKRAAINDYSMIGVQYGAGMSRVMWNPSTTQSSVLSPYNVGIVYTRYGKMFNFMPYFGFQAGIFVTQEGFRLKASKDSDYVPNIIGTGENQAVMNIIEAPILAHCHIDFWKMKLLINAGCYIGYRMSITRSGEYLKDEFANSFADYNNRLDYGLKGGIGFAFVFDPVEIHIQGMYKHSFSSLYEPDYYSDIYYRYAYPTNIVISVGLHFQITKRTGMTNRMLRDKARSMVYEKESGLTE